MKKRFFVSMFMVLVCLVCFSSSVYAEWHYGIGTGIFLLNVDGDQGFHIDTIDRSVEFAVDLKPDDVADLMESAFGFDGYATNGKWMIQYSLVNLVLQDDPSVKVTDNISIDSDFEFDVLAGDFTVGCPVFKNEHISLGAHTGIRYIQHKLKTKLALVTNSGVNALKKNIDEYWIDLLVGASANIKLADQWTWNNMFNAGIGGTEGTYLVNSGVNWRFYENWSATVYGKYTAVDLKHGDKGNSNWYIYDVDEFGWGLTVLYNW